MMASAGTIREDTVRKTKGQETKETPKSGRKCNYCNLDHYYKQCIKMANDKKKGVNEPVPGSYFHYIATMKEHEKQKPKEDSKALMVDVAPGGAYPPQVNVQPPPFFTFRSAAEVKTTVAAVKEGMDRFNPKWENSAEEEGSAFMVAHI